MLTEMRKSYLYDLHCTEMGDPVPEICRPRIVGGLGYERISKADQYRLYIVMSPNLNVF